MPTQAMKSSKNALLLVAHGSRRKESNQEVVELANTLAERNQYEHCTVAFLELAEPTIQQGFTTLVKQGATHIDVMPYFLAAGRHVIEDIPEEVNACQRAHPQISVRIAPHLAAVQQQMADLVLQLMSSAKPLDPSS